MCLVHFSLLACRKDFELGFKFPFYGQDYTRFWLNTAGSISLTNSLSNDPDQVQNFPVINVARLGPEHSWRQNRIYEIWWKQYDDRAVITFDEVELRSKDVPPWVDGPTSIFQAELYANGTITLTYVKLQVKSAVNVGLRPGVYASPETVDWWSNGGGKRCSGPWPANGGAMPAPGSWFNSTSAKNLLEGNSVVFSPPDYSPCVIPRESWEDPDPNRLAVKRSVRDTSDYQLDRYGTWYNAFQDNFTFPFYGTNYKGFYTSALGSIAPTNDVYSDDQSIFNILPQIDVMLPEYPRTSFQEAVKYQIWWKQMPDRAVIGFDNVKAYMYGISSFDYLPSTFTVELFWNGKIVMNFVDINVVMQESYWYRSKSIHVGVRPPNVGRDSVDWWPEGRKSPSLRCKPENPWAAAKGPQPPSVPACPDGSARQVESCEPDRYCDVIGMRSRTRCSWAKQFYVKNRCESDSLVYAAVMQDGVVSGWFCVPGGQDIVTLEDYSTKTDVYYTAKLPCGGPPSFGPNHHECVMVGDDEVCDWRRIPIAGIARYSSYSVTLDGC